VSELLALQATSQRKSFRTTGRIITADLLIVRNQPVAIKVSGFQQLHCKLEIHAPKLGNLPPWLLDPPRIDDKLTNEISKHEQPEALLAISNCIIDSYREHARVYTDASKTVDGKVGIGCFFEACQDNPERKLACRVTDNATVYAGEMAAIRLAIYASSSFQRLAQHNSINRVRTE